MISSFTINGVDVPVSDVTYRRSEELSYGFDVGSLIRQPSAPMVIETTVPLTGGIGALVKLLGPRETFGASYATLARRVRYGGRKGRSAMRRLLARALPVTMATTFGARFRGRCVMLDDREMLLRMSERRR